MPDNFAMTCVAVPLAAVIFAALPSPQDARDFFYRASADISTDAYDRQIEQILQPCLAEAEFGQQAPRKKMRVGDDHVPI